MITSKTFTENDDYKYLLDNPGVEADISWFGPVAGLNPFLKTTSGGRNQMFRNQHSPQIVALRNPEIPIVVTGSEKELAKTSYRITVRENCVVLYKTAFKKTVVLYVRTIDNNKLDILVIPSYHSLIQDFGFTYRITDVARRASEGTYLTKGAVLAEPHDVCPETGIYRPGVNMNVYFSRDPFNYQDGNVISESAAQSMIYDSYKKINVTLSESQIFLNIYGDSENYKPFPTTGEKIRPDGLLCAVRKLDPKTNLTLLGNRELMEFDPRYDNCYYTRTGEGSTDEVGSVVTELFIVKNGNKNHPITPNDYVEDLREEYSRFNTRCFDVYNDLRRNGAITGGVTNEGANFLVNAHNRRGSGGVTFTLKKSPVGLYSIDFTVKTTTKPKIGDKLTGYFGNKGVNVEIRPDDELPVDEYGNRADIMVSTAMAGNRLAPGLLYMQTIYGASRNLKKKVADIFSVKRISNSYEYELPVKYEEEKVSSAIALIKSFYEVFPDNPYINLLPDRYIAVINSILKKEAYIYYNVESAKPEIELALDLRERGFADNKCNIRVKRKKETVINGEIKTEYFDETYKAKGEILPMYYVVLNKQSNKAFTVTASPALNYLNLPTSNEGFNKYAMPFKHTPTKLSSETETRIQTQNLNGLFVAHYMECTTNTTFRVMLNNILASENPTKAGDVDRYIHPTKRDGAQEALVQMYRFMGAEFSYTNKVGL